MSIAQVVLSFGFVAAASFAAQDPVESEPFVWLDDLDLAREQAALEGKPVLAVFRCVP